MALCDVRTDDAVVCVLWYFAAVFVQQCGASDALIVFYAECLRVATLQPAMATFAINLGLIVLVCLYVYVSSALH